MATRRKRVTLADVQRRLDRGDYVGGTARTDLYTVLDAYNRMARRNAQLLAYFKNASVAIDVLLKQVQGDEEDRKRYYEGRT